MNDEPLDPSERQTEVIVSHRLGFAYPDSDDMTWADSAEADARLEAHIQWRIDQAKAAG